MPAPIAVFAYNRPEHLRRTLEALAGNELAGQSEVTIYCDGPKPGVDPALVEGARQVARQAQGFARLTICEREKNLGLAQSVITGVTEQIERHGRVIVVEDDIVTTPHFLSFINLALDHYANDPKVFTIGGWSPPVEIFQIPEEYSWDTFAILFTCSWGWGTWADRWGTIDWSMAYYHDFMADPKARAAFDRAAPFMTKLLRHQYQGEVDTWDIQMAYAQFSQNAHTIIPCRSLVNNAGFDHSGTHCGNDTHLWHTSLDAAWEPKKLSPGEVLSDILVKRYHDVWRKRPKEPRPWYKHNFLWRSAHRLRDLGRKIRARGGKRAG